MVKTRILNLAAVKPAEGDDSTLANVHGFLWAVELGTLSPLAVLRARIRYRGVSSYEEVLVRPGVFYRTDRLMESVQLWSAGVAAGTTLALDVADEPSDHVGSRLHAPRWCEVFSRVGGVDEVLTWEAPDTLPSTGGAPTSSGITVWTSCVALVANTTLVGQWRGADGTVYTSTSTVPVVVGTPRNGTIGAVGPGGGIRATPGAGGSTSLIVWVLG